MPPLQVEFSVDAFEDQYLCLDQSDIQEAAAQLEGFAECLACEGL